MEGSSMDSAGLPGQSSPSLIGDSQLDSTDFSTNASDLMADLIITEDNLSDKYLEVAPELLTGFFNFSQSEQMDLQKKIIQRMGPYQIGTIDRYIQPMLQRDFIAHLPQTIAENILRNLDYKSLSACEWVSTTWRNLIADCQLWRKLIEQHVKNDNLWRRLSEKREWKKFIMVRREEAARLICEHYQKNYEELKAAFKLTMLQHQFYKKLYSRVDRDITNIDDNWKAANFNLTRIQCGSEQSKGVYCLQYDDEKIVSGLRDNTIKIWDRRFNSSKQVLSGHTGSVLCLQYDNKVIISGSSDATVRVWDVNTGECLKTLVHHTEAVLDLRFSGGVMVTCSKDRSIAVWDMVSPKKISINQSLAEHSAAVNAVDFDERYIVSASGDKTIMVWSAVTKERVRTLSGHRRGIACLQYKGHLVVSGSSDNTIRLWNVDSGECLRVLEGHEELVRCIRFDDKRIVSGAYDGKIKIWDLPAALDPKSAPGSLCLSTLVKHTGRVFRLQFDGFQIVSSSHDDTILIWDFFDAGANQQNQREPVAVPLDQDEAIGAEENERGP